MRALALGVLVACVGCGGDGQRAKSELKAITDDIMEATFDGAVETAGQWQRERWVPTSVDYLLTETDSVTEPFHGSISMVFRHEQGEGRFPSEREAMEAEPTRKSEEKRFVDLAWDGSHWKPREIRDPDGTPEPRDSILGRGLYPILER